MSRTGLPVVLALCAMSSPCLATTAASASVTNLTFTLVDLSPGDGISPAILFSSPGMYGSTVTVRVDDSAGQLVGARSDGLEPFAPAGASVSGGPNWATGSIAAGSLPGAISLSASGSATKEIDSAQRSEFTSDATAPGTPFIWGNSTLTPRTSVTFAGMAQASVATSGGTGYQYAFATANMSMLPTSGSGYQSAGLWLEQNSTPAGGVYIGGSDQSSGMLSITFANDTDDVALGQFDVRAYVWGVTYAMPVPEPVSLVLMGFGLAGLAAANRRRGAVAPGG